MKPDHKNIIAIDMGASHGSIIIGILGKKKLALKESYRFAHHFIERNGTKYWDWEFIIGEIRKGLTEACKLTGSEKIESVSCSSWAQDFGLLDKQGALFYPPVSYRDDRTKGLPFAFSGTIQPVELHKKNGSTISPITTLCQLYSMLQKEPGYLLKAHKLLFMAGLVHYSLSGEAVTDWTHATASQMVNLKTKEWDTGLLNKLEIPVGILPEIIDNPRVIGSVIYPDIHPKFKGVPVISGAGHDTALASSFILSKESKTLFVSLGTWALIGCFDDHINTDHIEDTSLAILGIPWRKMGLFYSSTGLWLIQQCMEEWNSNGMKITYKELVDKVYGSQINSTIPPNDERFFSPEKMTREILEYCGETNQEAPECPEDFAKVIFDSLVIEFKSLIDKLKIASGLNFEKIQVVSGGSKNKYICSGIAKSTGIPVIAGPAEATAIGNICLQAKVLGFLGDETQTEELIKNSFPVFEYN